MNITIKSFEDSEEKWDEILQTCYKPSIHLSSNFLSIEDNIKKFNIFKSNELVGIFALKHSNEYKNIIPTNFLLYTPIQIIELKNSNKSKINLHNYNIINCIYNFLIKNYNNIYLNLNYLNKDIRPFLWHGHPEYKKKFFISVKYTSEINLSLLNNIKFDQSDMFKNLSTTIKQQIRYSINSNFEFKEYFSKSIFMKLIDNTFSKQNVKFDKRFYEIMLDNVKKLIDKKLIKSYVIYNNNKICFFGIYSTINTHSTLLFTGRSEDVDNKNYSGAFFFFNSFIDLKKNNIKTIDLEGINSPKRGFYKLGFGGKVKSYYNIKNY